MKRASWHLLFRGAALIMIIASKGGLSYPTFQRLLLRSVRRNDRQSHHALRYLVSNTSNGRIDKEMDAFKVDSSEAVDEASLAGTHSRKQDIGSAKKTKSENSITSTDICGSTVSSSTDSVKSSNVAPWSRNFVQFLRRAAGGVASTAGFLSSAATSIITDKAQFRRSKPTVDALKLFLNKSGIDLELSQSLNVHLLRNVIVLGRIQKFLAERSDRRELTRTKQKMAIPSREEALRYMKYATSAYGSNMIAAAEMGARGTFDTRFKAPLTKTRISEHIGIPEKDIVLADVEYSGDVNNLRHFVAVDHAQKKVVLSIRGTFTLSEILVDVAAFSRSAFGGEAHSQMMTMAQRVWSASGGTVRQLLRDNEGYELILTGHSLGAGTACLLNIMCHNDGKKLVDGRDVRCFSYAAPPVFSALELVPGAVQSTTNFIHEKDIVPFLSVDSVRHAFNCVRAIEEHMNKLGRVARFKLTTGISSPEDQESLINDVCEASKRRLKPKSGAPILCIPAAANVWMREQESGEYDYEVCDSVALSKLGLNIDLRMVEDHLPPRYEHAFENLVDKDN